MNGQLALQELKHYSLLNQKRMPSSLPLKHQFSRLNPRLLLFPRRHFFTLPFLSGLDQAPEGQQDFQMKSPLANLYGEASLELGPLFSSTSGAPAGSAAGPEVDDRDDISEGELVTG